MSLLADHSPTLQAIRQASMSWIWYLLQGVAGQKVGAAGNHILQSCPPVSFGLPMLRHRECLGASMSPAADEQMYFLAAGKAGRGHQLVPAVCSHQQDRPAAACGAA